MNIFRFSLKMLERNYKASIVYGMILMFAVAAIFIFTEIGANTNISIDSSLDLSMISVSNVMPSFVVMFGWIMVIYATNYYFSYKGKEFSLLYLSGASMFTKIRYIVYQILVVMFLVVPFGLVIGYGVITLLYNTLFASLYPVIYMDIFITTASSLFVVVAIIVMCTIGYVFKTSILDLQKGRKATRLYSYKKSNFKTWISIVGYLYSIYGACIIVVEGQTSILSGYILLATLCIVSLLGVFRFTIPRILNSLKRKKLIQNSCLLVGISYYLSAVKNNLVMMIFLLAIPTVFAPSLASQVLGGTEYIITVICFLFLMILCTIVLICKYLNHTTKRSKDYKMLSNIGYTSKQIKTILQQEIGLLFGSILLFPLPLVLIISYRYVALYNQTFLTFIFISLMYIVSILIGMVITYLLQYKIVIKGGKW